jgi:hypothetical protein
MNAMTICDYKFKETCFCENVEKVSTQLDHTKTMNHSTFDSVLRSKNSYDGCKFNQNYCKGCCSAATNALLADWRRSFGAERARRRQRGNPSASDYYCPVRPRVPLQTHRINGTLGHASVVGGPGNRGHEQLAGAAAAIVGSSSLDRTAGL